MLEMGFIEEAVGEVGEAEDDPVAYLLNQLEW